MKFKPRKRLDHYVGIAITDTGVINRTNFYRWLSVEHDSRDLYSARFLIFQNDFIYRVVIPYDSKDKALSVINFFNGKIPRIPKPIDVPEMFAETKRRRINDKRIRSR